MVNKCNNVSDRIDLAKSMIENEIIKYSQFNYLYPFTTENIDGYLDYFDLKDKSLLTVGSSGDQVFNAILSGCKDIKLVDICPFSKYYFYLKMAALMTLSREEYLKFFSYRISPVVLIRNNGTFDKKTFERVNEYLRKIDLEISYFWRELFNNYKGKTIRKSIFNSDECTMRVNCLMNRYLHNDEEYQSLRDKIGNANVSFECKNIFEYDDSRKYDNIFLSNILAYSNLKSYAKLFQLMKKYLADDGKMMFSYAYDTDCFDIYIDDCFGRYSKKEIEEAIDEPLEFISFIGNSGKFINDPRQTDTIITYRKVKKI